MTALSQPPAQPYTFYRWPNTSGNGSVTFRNIPYFAHPDRPLPKRLPLPPPGSNARAFGGGFDYGLLQRLADPEFVVSEPESVAQRLKGRHKSRWEGPVTSQTLTRTSLDSTTVTLPQLAERVNALIRDLKRTDLI